MNCGWLFRDSREGILTGFIAPDRKEIGDLKMSPKVTGGGFKLEQRLDQCV
jgi:hypothetical protein